VIVLPVVRIASSDRDAITYPEIGLIRSERSPILKNRASQK